ncbi:MAG: hypothetical protein HRT40_11950 [Campylobacteraceae bacterium]|nr:hypothetical protein [Campylobacteraceae bacterium]
MYLLSLILFILGVLIIITKELKNNRGISVDLSDSYLYLIFGGGLIIFSIYIVYLGFKDKKDKKDKNKIHKIEFSKCPICKENFTYSELNNGKCKYCEEVDTIDMDEYYEKFPDKS